MGRRKIEQENVIRKFREVHGDEYDYSKVVYTGARAKVVITCKVHGDFEKAVHSHLQGSRCRLCRNDKYAAEYTHSTEAFVVKCRLTHGERYDYSRVDYRGTRHKVAIVCREHGEFSQEAGHHQHGHGCPDCTVYGYDRTAAGVLYVLVCNDITKVGITNNGVKKRISRVSSASGKKFELLCQYDFDSGERCADAESCILAELRNKSEPVTEKFEGSTECFLRVDKCWLLDRLKELASHDR